MTLLKLNAITSTILCVTVAILEDRTAGNGRPEKKRAHCRILTFCNEGHDIHIALKKRQVKVTTAAVCSFDKSNKNAEVRKLEGFSKFHNFSFEFEGIRAWRCYGIGSGKFLPYRVCAWSRNKE